MREKKNDRQAKIRMLSMDDFIEDLDPYNGGSFPKSGPEAESMIRHLRRVGKKLRIAKLISIINQIIAKSEKQCI